MKYEDNIPGVAPDMTVSTSINNMPFKVFKRFKQYASSQAGDTYWVAIDKLLYSQEQIERLERQLAIYEQLLGLNEVEESTDTNEVKETPLTLG